MATQQEYEDILLYKNAPAMGKYREGLDVNQKRNIRDKASRYIVEHNCLYVIGDDSGTGLSCKRRVIVNIEEKERILSMCHSGIDGMHFGRDKTYKKVSELHLVTLWSS